MTVRAGFIQGGTALSAGVELAIFLITTIGVYAPSCSMTMPRDLAQLVAMSEPRRVLELAAGAGIVTRHLRDLLPPATHLTATDLNPPMIDVARTKFNVGEQVEFQLADATALPFPDGAFDAVIFQFGVMFFPDKDKSYREVNRVLARAGGRYVFSVWDRDGRHGRIVERLPAASSPSIRRSSTKCRSAIIKSTR